MPRCQPPCEYAPFVAEGECRHCHGRPPLATLVLADGSVIGADTVERLLVRCFNGDFDEIQQGAETNQEQRLSIEASFFDEPRWPNAAYVITDSDGTAIAAIVNPRA